MSAPAIYIEPQGTTLHVPPRYIRPRPPAPARIRAPAIPNHMVRYSVSPICHTEFGIRNSGIGIRDLETGQFLLRPVLFRV